jgi:hypothetical protein
MLHPWQPCHIGLRCVVRMKTRSSTSLDLVSGTSGSGAEFNAIGWVAVALQGVIVAGALVSLLNLAVLVFSVTSMLSVGFSYTLREIAKPLRNLRGVLLALAAKFVLVPLLAYVVSRLLSLERRDGTRYLRPPVLRGGTPCGISPTSLTISPGGSRNRRCCPAFCRLDSSPARRPMLRPPRLVAGRPASPDRDELLANLESTYKDIHAKPELAMQEHRTAGTAADLAAPAWISGYREARRHRRRRDLT